MSHFQGRNSGEPSESDETLPDGTPYGQTRMGGGNSSDANRSRLNELVRGYSLELVRTASHVDPSVNPFLSTNPSLDPSRPDQFDAKQWAKALLQHSEKDPARYPRHSAGVAFRSLSVHGYGTDTDYQKNVLNVLLQGPLILKQWVSNRRQEIRILRDLDGLVKKGEMLLVLGRPGSGVTSLLKTISGETDGLHLDATSHMSYQGQSSRALKSRDQVMLTLSPQASQPRPCTRPSGAK